MWFLLKWVQILVICRIFCNVWVWLQWLRKIRCVFVIYHVEEKGNSVVIYTFNFSQATLIIPIHCKKFRRLLESAVISKTNYIKQRPGFYQIEWVVKQTRFFNLDKEVRHEEGKVWVQTCRKKDLESHPVHAEKLGQYLQ